MKKSLILFSALLSTCACPCEGTVKDQASLTSSQNDQQSEKDIIRYAQNYMDYLEKIGKSSSVETKGIPHPFSTQSTKIINGEVVARNANEFVNQLQGLRKNCEGWTIEVLEIIPSPSTKTATIRYNMKAPPLGAFTIMKVARFDDQGNVREINEVFSQLKEEQIKK